MNEEHIWKVSEIADLISAVLMDADIPLADAMAGLSLVIFTNAARVGFSKESVIEALIKNADLVYKNVEIEEAAEERSSIILPGTGGIND